MELTSVERCGELWLKREDEFVVGGACGGKARVIDAIVRDGLSRGLRRFCTCGSRDSRQCRAVAFICAHYGLESHLFMPSGQATVITDAVLATEGATLHRTKVGYNNVLNAQARAWAEENGARYISMGMEEWTTINVNMHQVQNIPEEVSRIVIPLGSGMQMISVIRGLQHYGMEDKKVLGVIVGKDPTKTFERFIGDGLFDSCNVEYSFVQSGMPYGREAPARMVGDVEVDGIYEAKCLPFLRKNDLFWIVGK